MKKWLLLLLIISICLNIYQFGKVYWTGLFTPNEEDEEILGEMVQLVVESEAYEELTEKEKVYSITTSVDRFKGGSHPYQYEVVVSTDKQSYSFTCTDAKCADVELGGWFYSRYTEEAPILPFK